VIWGLGGCFVLARSLLFSSDSEAVDVGGGADGAALVLLDVRERLGLSSASLTLSARNFRPPFPEEFAVACLFFSLLWETQGKNIKTANSSEKNGKTYLKR